MAKGAGHLLFVSKSSGYELAEHDGEPPQAGSEVEEAETRYVVTKVGRSPLPGDERPCAYLNAI